MAAVSSSTLIPQTPMQRVVPPSPSGSADSEPMPTPPKATSEQDQAAYYQQQQPIHPDPRGKLDFNQEDQRDGDNQESDLDLGYSRRRTSNVGISSSNSSSNNNRNSIGTGNGNPEGRCSPIFSGNRNDLFQSHNERSPSPRSLAASLGAPSRSSSTTASNGLGAQLGLGRPSASSSSINQNRPGLGLSGRSSSYGGASRPAGGGTTSSNQGSATNNPVTSSSSSNSIVPSISGPLRRSARQDNVGQNGSSAIGSRRTASASVKSSEEEMAIHHRREPFSSRTSDPQEDLNSKAPPSKSRPSISSSNGNPVASALGKRPHPTSEIEPHQPPTSSRMAQLAHRRTASSTVSQHSTTGRNSNGSVASGSGSGSGDSSQEKIQQQQNGNGSDSSSPSNTTVAPSNHRSQHLNYEIEIEQDIKVEDEPSSQPLPTPPVVSSTSNLNGRRARPSATVTNGGIGSHAGGYVTPHAQIRTMRGSALGASGLRDRSVQRNRISTAGRPSLGQRPAPSARRVLRTQDEEDDDDEDGTPSVSAAEENNSTPPTTIKQEHSEGREAGGDRDRRMGLQPALEEEEEERKPFGNIKNRIKSEREEPEDEAESNAASGVKRGEIDAEMEDLDGSPGVGRNAALPSSQSYGGYVSNRNLNPGGSDRSNLNFNKPRARAVSPLISKKHSDEDLPRSADRENLPVGYEFGAEEDEEAEMEEEREHERSLLMHLSPAVERVISVASPTSQPPPARRSEAYVHPKASERTVLKEGQDRAASAAAANRRDALEEIKNAKINPSSVAAVSRRNLVPPSRIQTHAVREEEAELLQAQQQYQAQPQSQNVQSQYQQELRTIPPPTQPGEEELQTDRFFDMMIQEGFRQHNSSTFDSTPLVGNKDPAECKDTILNHNKFKKLRRIGEGGFSTVWSVKGPQFQIQQAVDPATGELVAMKIPVPDENQAYFAMKQVNLKKLEPQSKAELIQEAELLDQLSQKEGNDRYILRYFGCRIGKDSMKILLEVGERDFSNVLRKEPLNRDDIKKFFIQMLEAVEFVHTEGQLVHTDLKPGNFLLVKNRIKLIDFGIAQKIPAHTIHISRDAIVGTPNYMAPEAIKIARKDGRKVFKAGKASDVWSLGCILYQMVYGRPPFDRYASNERMNVITNPNHQIPFPSHRDLDDPDSERVDQKMIDTIRWALKYDPRERATIKDLLEGPFLGEGLDDMVTISRKTVRDIYRKVMEMQHLQGLPDDLTMDELGDRLFENLLKEQS